MRSIAFCGIACWLVAGSWPSAAQDVPTYPGTCDASAAAALSADDFVVGNDGSDILFVYRRGQPLVVGTLDLSKFLDAGEGREAGIEGAAAVGTRIYWITSHGRNGKARVQKGRRRFFATDIRRGMPPVLTTAGTAYRDLLADLEAFEPLKPYGLTQAAKKAADAQGGLAIEGLAATPEGHLLIGLRNPLPHGHALIVPLENPDELLEGKHARFGTPMELDLAGRGIRSIELVGSSYLLVAGPIGDAGKFALYRWSGKAGESPTPLTDVALGTLRPTALFAIPGTDQVQLLSGDGGVMVDGAECGKLPTAKQEFRSLIVRP